MAQAETTTDHDTIKQWVEQRGGRPSAVRDTAGEGDAGILRIDFGPPEDELEEIGWDDFFAKFDAAKLAFLFQEKTADGQESRFHKFVRREAH